MGKKIKHRIGIDLGSHSFKLVSWHTSKKDKKFKTLKTLDLANEFSLKDKHQIDDTHLMEGIKLLMDNVTTRGASIRVCLSEPTNNLFFLNIPVVSKSEINQSIAWALSPLLQLPVDNYEKDYLIMDVDKKSKSQNILVGALEKNRLKLINKAFKRAGYTIDILESDHLALADFFLDCHKSLKEPVGLLDIGATKSNYSILSSKLPPGFVKLNFGGNNINKAIAKELELSNLVVESIRRGLTNEEDLKKFGKNIDKGYKAAVPILKDFLQKIHFFNLDYKKKHDRTIKKVFLSGGLLGDKTLEQSIIGLGTMFNLKFETWNPLLDFYKDEDTESINAYEYSSALGIALR